MSTWDRAEKPVAVRPTNSAGHGSTSTTTCAYERRDSRPRIASYASAGHPSKGRFV